MSSKSEAPMRAFFRVAIALFLVSPYLLWLIRVPQWTWPESAEWLPTAARATGQAFWSSFFAMIAGFFLFMGLQAWSSPRAKKLSELALLLPNMIPPLFLVISLMSWVTPFRVFPYGLAAVVFAHVLINSGLVAVALDRLVQAKLSGMAETAWTLGSTRVFFWRKVAWPALKSDLACLFLFVFGICFTSFSIPIVLGGEKQSTLEVAIWDSIRSEGRWDKAVILAGLQSLFLLTLAIALPRPFWPPRPRRRSLEYLSSASLRMTTFVPLLIVFGGWVVGLRAMSEGLGEKLPLYEAVLTTIALGITVGLIHLVLFLIVCYVTPHDGLHRMLNAYLAPSSSITGFAMLLLPGGDDLIDFVKLALALSLISFPLLYRWAVHEVLSEVRRQTVVARTLGASWSMILFEVVWPQVSAPLLRASGLAALWGASDFAVSGIVAGNLKTLPLLMSELMGNYRIEAAEILMFPLLLVALGLYALFTGVERYVSG